MPERRGYVPGYKVSMVDGASAMIRRMVLSAGTIKTPADHARSPTRAA